MAPDTTTTTERRFQPGDHVWWKHLRKHVWIVSGPYCRTTAGPLDGWTVSTLEHAVPGDDLLQGADDADLVPTLEPA